MTNLHSEVSHQAKTQHSHLKGELESIIMDHTEGVATHRAIILESEFDRVVRRGAQLSVLLGSILFGMAFLYGAYQTMNSEAWIVQLAQKHFAATVGLPFAALAALCLVVILEINAGKVQMKGLGFEFRGATGPIIMWMACFMVISFAIKMTWDLGN